MKHPCDRCPKALPERFCTWYDHPMRCPKFKAYMHRLIRTPIRRVGKVSARRAKNMAKWKESHPVPAVCPECGMAPDWRGMSIHHKTKRSQGGDESDDNLTWLCARCHARFHGEGE